MSNKQSKLASAVESLFKELRIRQERRRMGRASESNLARRRLRLEILDRRDLMAADLTANFDPAIGLLDIEGTDRSDNIVIQQSSGRLAINGLEIRNLATGELSESLPSTHVFSIRIDALDGEDNIHFDDTLAQDNNFIPINVFGGAGADVITTGRGNDFIEGGEGDDSVAAGGGIDMVYGEAGNDWLFGEAGDDMLLGGDGFDYLFGGDGVDILDGGADLDYLFGEGDTDYLFGGDGSDALYGGAGNDFLWGGEEIDNLEGGEGNDWLYGEGGEDWLYGDEGNDWLEGGNDNDFLEGGADHDTLLGQAGDDTLLGGLGNDILQGGTGADVLNDFMGGYDTLDYGEDRLGVRVDLAALSASGGNAEGDTLVGSFEQVWGGSGNDILIGNAGSNRIYGNGGDDTIDGAAGNDYLFGGDGNDLLLGGDGNDEIWGENGNDQLNGQAGSDRLLGGAGNDTLVAIDAAYADFVDGGADLDVLWVDGRLSFFRVGISDQAVSNGDVVRYVSSFVNGADRTLNGDRIADPATFQTSTGLMRPYRSFMGNPLFSSLGPRLDDIRQGEVGDCYALAGLGAVVAQDPNIIRSHVVDFSDGTYGVMLGYNFYRVDNDLPVLASGSSFTAFAGLGRENSMWVPIMEKAFAHHRTGANSYESINGGWSAEMKQALGLTSIGGRAFDYRADQRSLANEMLTRFRNGECLTFDFTGNITWGFNVPLLQNHSYVLSNLVVNEFGAILRVELYNPWGVDGIGNDGRNDGYISLTLDQLFDQNGLMSWGRIA